MLSRRLAFVEGREPRPVVGTDRSHVGGGAVGQHHVGLEGDGIAAWETAQDACRPRGPSRETTGTVARPDGRMRGPPVRRVLLQIVHAAASRSPSATSACATEATLGTAGIDVEGDGLDPSGDLDDEIDEPIAPDTGLDGGDAPTSDQVVKAALTDVNAFWQRTYEDLYGTPYEPISGGLLALRARHRAAAVRRAAAHLRRHRRQRLLLPRRRPHRVGRRDPDPRAVRRVRRLHPRHRVRPRVRPRHPDPCGNDPRPTPWCSSSRPTASPGRGPATWRRATRSSSTSTLDDLDKAVAGFLALRDGVGTSAEDPAAHGTGFDRIGSFVEGYEQGVEQLRRLPGRRRRPATWWSSRCPSTGQDDFERGGNLPLDELAPILVEDLENFWTILFEERARTGPRSPTSCRSTQAPPRWSAAARLPRRRLVNRPSTASTTTPSTSTR